MAANNQSKAGKVRVHHIVRTVTATPDPENANQVTGVQADEYVSSFVARGWSLHSVVSLGMSPEGVSVLWVLTR